MGRGRKSCHLGGAFGLLPQAPKLSTLGKSANSHEHYFVAGPCKLPVDKLEPTAGEVRELYVLADYQKHKMGTMLMVEALE